MLHAVRYVLSTAALVLAAAIAGSGQTIPANGDGSVLKQIIIFGRHGVRSEALPYASLAQYTSRPYPDFGVPAGYLTPHGYQAEVLLGHYFYDYLLNQEVLTGNAGSDLKHSYFRANSIQRSNVSATALGAALLPGVTVPVHSYSLGTPDPVFDPIAANVVTKVDTGRAVREIQGTFDDGAYIQSAYAPELSLIRSLLYNYPAGTEPPPATPSGLTDPTTVPIPLTANAAPVTSDVINIGGLFTTLYAADPFVMEYTDGLPLEQVAWGQLSLAGLSQQTRIITLVFNLEITPPYLDRLQSSNAASHILRTMEQAVVHETNPGAFGDSKSKLVVVNSSDSYVEGVAGLLHAHWLLPGYQPDYCAPGGSLVFELRQSRSGEDFVRVFYTAQTFDQLRNLTPLSLDQPPATMQLFIPGGSKSASSLDIGFEAFDKLLKKAIDENDVQNPATEVPPGVLTGVPLQ